MRLNDEIYGHTNSLTRIYSLFVKGLNLQQRGNYQPGMNSAILPGW